MHARKGRGKGIGSKSLASPCSTDGDEICEWSDQWTQSKQLYVHFYEFNSKKLWKARWNLVYVVAVLLGSTRALESGVGSSWNGRMMAHASIVAATPLLVHGRCFFPGLNYFYVIAYTAKKGTQYCEMVLAWFTIRENVNSGLLFLGIILSQVQVFSFSLPVYCGQWNSYFTLHVVNAVNQNLRYT